MGEYVAIAWGEEEKSMFSSIIKSNSPSLDKSFWDEIYKYFRNKSREELRRANQNRTTPSSINSDDEEPEEEPESVVLGCVEM
ncbi:AT-rich interactive domain-containing protein 1-like [Gossypium australe]|uniref:AT-rich interactive domain-containing protein 1-like n=1 Tax=Gossypium australe TaxID=47621 RepID=A0A5B6UY95_9ROSI|nr:AT-rich interactive domain-containing protein 1-like [Gossypium australe]